jgi:Flp pilus assembly protein TadG
MLINWRSLASDRLIRDTDGVSAVEFGLIAPLMVSLYLGCVEISDGVSAQRKVTLVASTIANLTAQSTTLSTTDVSNILDASTAIIYPYSSSTLKMTISGIAIDANKNATVKWSVTPQRHRAVGKRHAADHAAGRQYAARLLAGLVWLPAGRRLHHHRQAGSVGADVHDAAHHRADLQYDDLHLSRDQALAI